jgi:hypothetical protein
LAQPPDISETFMREVDENLRRDQLRDFFKSYGNWIIVAVLLFLAASGGYIWWNQHSVQRSGEQVEKLAQIYKDIASGDQTHSAQQLDQMANSGNSKAVRPSSQFARAAIALQQGDTKFAIATYKAAANDSSLPGPYRDVALIRQTALEFDSLQPQEIVARLAPLAKPGEPWFGSAGEMTALAMLKQGNKQQAAQLLAAISKDSQVPEAIRTRAGQLAGTLGVEPGAALSAQAQ